MGDHVCDDRCVSERGRGHDYEAMALFKLGHRLELYLRHLRELSFCSFLQFPY